MPNRRPNIILIMSDQHNAHVMGCADNGIVQTPNLDELARTGVHFTSAYCPYPLCVPSRMAFMTGQYPSTVNVWDNGSVLSSSIPTFAHALGAAGYEANLCGRMHFVGPDQFHGFEKRLFGDNGPFLSKEICGHGFNRTNGQTKYAVEVSGHGSCGYQEYDRLVTEHACRFVDDHDPADRPYCLVVGYTLPHNPLICRRDLFEYYLERIPVPEPVSEEYLAKLNPGLRKWRERRGVDDLTPEQNHRALAAYYGLVTEMDQNVGAIVEAARTSAAGDSTVVIYCSDHGDHACEHGMWWKSSHLEGAARVPLLVSWPGQLDGGRTVEAVVSLIDVGPTVLELAGADPLPDVAGRSLVGFLRRDSAPADWPNEIFCEYIGAHGDQPSCMVRSGDWKLIYYAEFDSHLLYNLKTDPEELDDRAGDPACAEMAKTLLEKIHRRWSAAKMLEGDAKERRAQALIRGCGHPLIPHPVPRTDPLERANQFDFNQVPNWTEIRKRFDNPPDAPS